MSEEEDLKPSKTRLKKDMHELQDVGEALVELSADRLKAIDIPDSLRDAVMEAKRLNKREARRRQMQYIGRLMRDIDAGPIRAKLDEWQGRSHAAIAALHRVERWRDRLLEDEAAFTAFAAEYPGTDLQPLRACVREARKEREAQRPVRHYRDLYKLIRAIDELRGTKDAE